MNSFTAESEINPVSAGFRYTFEDYKEAYLIVERRQQRLSAEMSHRASSLANVLRAQVIVAMVVSAAALILIMRFRSHIQLPAFLTPRVDEYFQLQILLPIALFFVTVASVGWLEHRARYAGTRLTSSPADKRARVVNVAASLLAVCLLGGLAVYYAVVDRELEELAHAIALLVAPWVVIFVWLVVKRVEPWHRAGGLIKAQWDAARQFHLDKFVALDESAFRLWDVEAHYEFRWEGIDACEEGDNLFALLVGSVFYILPKRAMTPEQIIRLRERFAPTIATATGGFPVVRAKSPGT